MAQLDETIAAGQTGHIADHDKIHKKANYVFDVMDYGAVGDGVADDTAALDSAVAAADTAGRGTVYLPLGTYITTGIALTGTGVNIQGEGPGSILKGKSGITGAVLDFNGWTNPPHNVGDGIFRDFNIEGDSTADAGKTHYGMDTSGVAGGSFLNIGIRFTGGPGWYSTSGSFSTFRDITVGRPTGADTNDVPYIYFRGWMNGNLFDGVGVRNATGDTDGSSVWLIEDDGTVGSHDSSIKACWIENCDTPENGAIWQFSLGNYNIECPQMFDSSASSNNQTGSCVLRISPLPNGGTTTSGGNYIWGQIPGDEKAVRSYPFGVELLTSRNFVHGVRGFDGRNVHIGVNVEYTSVLMGGRVSGVTSSILSVIDDSTKATNFILDLAVGNFAIPDLEIDNVNSKIGFFGVTAIVKPTVTGARDETEGALKDLLTELAALGLITDSSTQS